MRLDFRRERIRVGNVLGKFSKESMMKKGDRSSVPVVIAGALVGLIVGCLITWLPIRLLFCAAYNAPDCEEIVLMVFPLYCFIMPLIGSVVAYLLYRRQGEREATGSDAKDRTGGESKIV